MKEGTHKWKCTCEGCSHVINELSRDQMNYVIVWMTVGGHSSGN